MESLYEVDLQKKVNFMVDGYVASFKQVFNKNPLIEETDRASVRALLHKTGISKTEIVELVAAYFSLDDEWIAKQGYPLRLIGNKYNALLTGGRVVSRSPIDSSPLYVIAFIQSDNPLKNGWPVTDRNPHKMGNKYWWKPMPLKDWLNLPFEKRLMGNPVSTDVINLWKEHDIEFRKDT